MTGRFIQVSVLIHGSQTAAVSRRAGLPRHEPGHRPPRIFDDADDYLAFERVLAEALRRVEGRVRLCAYAVMPNHFHLVLWPTADRALSRFMQWLTLTHAQRWHAHRHTAGTGALYGARFKCFPVREDEHFLKVCRYVERNPLRAGLVARAEHWPWGSLHKRDPRCAHRPGAAELLDAWPVDRPPEWAAWVNEPESAAELAAMRNCVRRERPFGDDAWAAMIAARIGSEQSLRPRGRPKATPAPAAVLITGETDATIGVRPLFRPWVVVASAFGIRVRHWRVRDIASAWDGTVMLWARHGKGTGVIVVNDSIPL